MNEKGQIYIITGEIDTGKTSLCLAAADFYRKVGWQISGITSIGIFHGDKKIGYDAQNLKTLERRLLAVLRRSDAPLSGPETKRWIFDKDAVQWCNEVLSQSSSADLLIVDEIGPLEFERGDGFIDGIKALDRGLFRLGLVVVRNTLLEMAQKRWPAAENLNISTPEDIDKHLSTLQSLFYKY